MEWKWKNYQNIDEFMKFENGMIDKKDFLSPFKTTVKNMDMATSLIFDCILNDYNFYALGDYDVDGICSLKILSMIFEYLDIPLPTRTPKRISEGYGLSEKIIEEILENKKGDKNILITIDNGISAINQIKKLKENGYKVIIIDHHEPLIVDGEVLLPEADVIVDPIVFNGEFNNYCAAGLGYKLAEALNLPEELMKEISAYAMLATIADVMPLIKENRNIVIEGLNNVNNKEASHVIEALMDVCNIQELDEEGVGYNIGPMLNAPGRLFDNGARISLDALMTKNYGDAFNRFVELVDYNNERKRICEFEYNVCKAIIKENNFPINRPFVLYGKFNEGIVGILAGKLAEEYQVPSIVLTESEIPNRVKGSGRTAQNESLIDMIRQNDSYLLTYGGHPGAAGLSLKEENINPFREGFSSKEYVRNTTVEYDLEVKVSKIKDFFSEQVVYAPFGEGNKKPLVKVRIELNPRSGVFYKELANGKYAKLFGDGYNAMLFDGIIQEGYENMFDKWKKLGCPSEFDALVYVCENVFNGYRSIQLNIQDLKLIEKETTQRDDSRNMFLSYFN